MKLNLEKLPGLTLTLNLNDHVEVRLTDKGREVMVDHAHALNVAVAQRAGHPVPSRPAPPSRVVTLTLWEFAAIFGPHFSHGGDPLVENSELKVIPAL